MMGFIQKIKKGGLHDNQIEEVKSLDYSQYEQQNEFSYDITPLFMSPLSPKKWTDASNFTQRVNKLYFQCSVSRACIEKRAQGISDVEVIVTGKASTKKLLQSPNPTDKTLSNSLRVWETSLTLGGDLYLFYDLRNAIEPYIWTLRQDLIKNNTQKRQFEYIPTRLSSKNEPPQYIFEYDKLGNTTRCLERDGKNYKVINGYLQRIAYHNPLTASEGAGAGDSALRAVDILLAIDELAHNKFGSGGAKSGMIEAPAIRSAKDLADAKAALENLNQQNGINVLVNGMKFNATQLTFAEMDLINMRAVQAASVQDAFKVPGVLLNSTTQTTYANMRSGDKIFYRTFIGPEAKWLIGQVEWGIRKYIDETATLAVDETQIDHIQDDQLQMAKDMASTGCFTANEVREVLGKKPVEGGDELMKPAAVQNGQPEEKPRGETAFNADAGDRGDANTND
ncbi:phage portal protein [Sphingobium chungangianum]